MGGISLRRIGRALLVPALAVITALLIGAVVMLIFGDDPLAAYRGLFSGAFGNGRAWSTTIRKMTPLILTGLSVSVAFKAGLFNINVRRCDQHSLFRRGWRQLQRPAIYVHLPLALLAGIAQRGML